MLIDWVVKHVLTRPPRAKANRGKGAGARPQIAISTEIGPDLNNRLTNKLLFIKLWVFCFADSCRKLSEILSFLPPPCSEMAGLGPAPSSAYVFHQCIQYMVEKCTYHFLLNYDNGG